MRSLIILCLLTVYAMHALAINEKRVLLHSDMDLDAALQILQQNFTTQLQQLASKVTQLETKNQQLESRLSLHESTQSQAQNRGSVYVRWGRSVCPGNGTDRIYKGYIGGSYYSQSGGGANSQCLPDTPTWNSYVDGYSNKMTSIYGTEVEDESGFSTKAFGYNYHNQDPPCAACQSARANVLMIPGRANCYPGWTTEYTGYLVGARESYASDDYICLDSRPEELPHGLDSTSNDQHLLYFVEAHCGSLPCPPYHAGREIACVVCSK